MADFVSGILQPELTSIEELFAGTSQYRVPVYQRSFAWGTDEVTELWEDIQDSLTRQRDYFLGTIVLQVGSASEFQIIDGQQRLTCLTTLFSAIRYIFTTQNDTQRAVMVQTRFLGSNSFERDAQIEPKLVLNKDNDTCFRRYIIESESPSTIKGEIRQPGTSESNRLLLQAYLFFVDKVAAEITQRGQKSDEFIVPLIDLLRSRVKLIAIKVQTGEDANLFFESLNARGKELAVSDLVKNRLYSAAGKQLETAQQYWEKMASDLGRLSIPEYLRHFWIAQKADQNSPVVREKQLYRLVVTDLEQGKKDSITLLQNLSDCARDYARIGDYSLWPADNEFGTALQDCLSELQLFRVMQCNPLLLNTIQKFSESRDVARVFRTVANFSFRYFIIGNQSPGNLERQTSVLAVQLRQGTLQKPSEIADAFRAINPDQQFRADFREARIRQTNAKIARYTLAKISNYLFRSSGSSSVVSPDEKHVSLEHILPKSLPDYWVKLFKNKQDAADYVYRIGNLTLLRSKLNDELADSAFDEKKAALLDDDLPINKSIAEVDAWGSDAIETRQEALAKLAIEVWKLD